MSAVKITDYRDYKIHDCAALDAVHPPECGYVDFSFKCPTCGMRWKGTKYSDNTGSSQGGRPSWRWRRRMRRKAQREQATKSAMKETT